MKPQINQIKSRMQIVINAVKALGDELKKVEIGKEQVADQYMPVINDAKSTLLIAIQKETSEQLPEIRNFDDVLALRERTNRLLNRLGDTSGSHRRVIHSFFGKYSKVLKFQLGLMDKEIKHLNELIDEYTEKTSSLSECKTSISRIDMVLKESGELARKSEEAKNELVMLKTKETELVKKIDNMHSVESFGQYKTDKEELGKVRKDAESVLSEINAAFSRISRPVNKYTYEVGLDKESNYIVQSVMEDSSRLVHDAKVEQLIEILNKVKAAVMEGKIVVKNPDKDIENINALVANVHQYVDAYRKIYDKIQALSARTSPIDSELDRLRSEIERSKNDVRQKESFLNDYTRKVENAKSTINSELNNITERIDGATGSRVKVTI